MSIPLLSCRYIWFRSLRMLSFRHLCFRFPTFAFVSKSLLLFGYLWYRFNTFAFASLPLPSFCYLCYRFATFAVVSLPSLSFQYTCFRFNTFTLVSLPLLSFHFVSLSFRNLCFRFTWSHFDLILVWLDVVGMSQLRAVCWWWALGWGGCRRCCPPTCWCWRSPAWRPWSKPSRQPWVCSQIKWNKIK
jgi:hypothetical protein